MINPIIIKPMNITHLDDIAQLEKACFAHPWSYDSLLEYLGNPSAYFFAAVANDGELVGYIGTYIVADEAYVTNICVNEKFRHQGVGTALVKEASDNAKRNHASFISLEVRVSNEAAVALYKNAGFETDGIRPNFYRDPKEDAYIMTKRF